MGYLIQCKHFEGRSTIGKLLIALKEKIWPYLFGNKSCKKVSVAAPVSADF
jgi:hypothetical protein